MYKSQLAVVEQALETAGLMLGTNKSRGYCLEMICADFFGRSQLGRPKPRGPDAFVAQRLPIIACGTEKSIPARD
jgi:hypothetical protein